jgi:hypothetical protein
MAVRLLPTDGALSPTNLEETFERYAALSWPGVRVAVYWTDGNRRGATGVFEEAMPGHVIREWLVTDGESLANASTYATTEGWRDMIEDCERLVRSIRFEPNET